MSIWLIMIACGGLTFLSRFLPLTGLLPRKLPPWFEQAMGLVPIAVLTPIITHAIFITSAGGFSIADNHRLPAAFVALVTALVSRSVVLTLATGFATLWGLDYLI